MRTIEREKERLSGKGNGGALEIKKEDVFSGSASLMDLVHHIACCFVRLLNSFGMAWCVYHGNGAHGSLRSDGELVGRHSENGLPPCELEGLQIKVFCLLCVCVRAHVYETVDGWVGGGHTVFR